MAANKAILRFRAQVWKYYQADGRHDLAWRKTKDPYKIMVSEVMLQQTQVPRVIEKYQEFLDAFPTVESLARSHLADVLKVWSGMGYNRRGKYLRDAAIAIVQKYHGKVPRDARALRALPGIGPYSASAILIFAFNMPDTMIETNVRSAFIHGFFDGKTDKKISDRELVPLVAQAAEGQDPRTWHWALMDYGSHLKKTVPNPSRVSAHHVKQSKFEGSLRQVRGAILRELHKDPVTEPSLRRRFNLPQSGLPQVKLAELKKALAGLARDGMIKKERGKWMIE